jgi:hypothetical protein
VRLPFIVAAALAIATSAMAQSVRDTSTTAKSVHDSIWTNPRTGMTYRFYTGKEYGSESSFNPASEILNEGFDVFGMLGQDKRLFARDFDADFRNVFQSVMHADQTYREYGWSVVKNEFLPITSTRVPGGGSWLPNYEAHLMGSGMVSRKMTEWYDMHGVPHPAIAAGLTMFAAHFANETVENNGFRRRNEDATTDLLFFDLGGIYLWQWGAMQRAFSGTFQLENWPLQPSINPQYGTLENAGQNFVLRGPIPFSDKWRWFYFFGLSGAGGVTRVLGDGYGLSLGAGMDAIDNPVVDSTRGARTVTLRPKGAIYLDRNGSLLGSFSVGTPNGLRSRVSAELYPGFLGTKDFKPGLWLQVPRAPQPGIASDGKLRLGIVSQWGLGIAGGAHR